MKKQFLTFILFIISSITFQSFTLSNASDSIQRRIKITGQYGGRILKSPLPEKEPVEAYIENNRIIIYFNLPCTNDVITISVQNTQGQIISEEAYVLKSPDYISFYVDKAEGELYTIEISGENGHLTGVF